jgi:hypothetical protein
MFHLLKKTNPKSENRKPKQTAMLKAQIIQTRRGTAVPVWGI